MNKTLTRLSDLNAESLNLINKAIYRTINSLRHIDITGSRPLTNNERHIADQLIRVLEFLADIRAYQLKMVKSIRSYEFLAREHKRMLRGKPQEMDQLPPEFWETMT